MLVIFTLAIALKIPVAYACMPWRPQEQRHFDEVYKVYVPGNFPKGVKVEMYNSDIDVSSSSAYPVYILTKTGKADVSYSRGNITFPAGYVPVSALVNNKELEYSESKNSWDIRRVFSQTDIYDPSTSVDLYRFNFKNDNVSSLNPLLVAPTPSDEDEVLGIWVNSQIYDVMVTKSCVKNPEYRKLVAEQLKADFDRTKDKYEAELKKPFYQIIYEKILDRFFPTSTLSKDCG